MYYPLLLTRNRLKYINVDVKWFNYKISFFNISEYNYNSYYYRFH